MQPIPKHKRIAGWGNYPVQQCSVYRPERQREIADIVVNHPSTLVARGGGRSFGDAALNWEGVVGMERVNRFLDFDTQNGVIKAQAGVTLKEILSVVMPLGWFLPVLPDTAYRTLGGCFACNVHGHNAFREGQFARHVLKIKLRLPAGNALECSSKENAELFWGTAGGMGLTGIIEEVTLQLKPIASASVNAESFRTHSIDDMVQAFRDRLNDEATEYMFGWLNHFGRNRDFGKGIFTSARHASAEAGTPLFSPKAPAAPKPFPVPGFLVNGSTIGMHNNARLKRYKDIPKTEMQGIEAFFCPYDRYTGMSALFGKGGLLRYQFILPDTDELTHRIQFILEALQQGRQYAYQTVLRYHGPQEGMLSFGMRGVSVTLDFPSGKKILSVLSQIDNLVADYGGRVSLADDARLDAAAFFRMYAQQIDPWLAIVQQADPGHRMISALSRRLKLRGA